MGQNYSFLWVKIIHFLKRIIAKIIDYLLETAFTILAMLQFIYRIFMTRGYARDMPEICPRYAPDMPMICPKYAQDIPTAIGGTLLVFGGTLLTHGGILSVFGVILSVSGGMFLLGEHFYIDCMGARFYWG